MKHVTITQEQADAIDRNIRNGYYEIARENRLGYPAYKLTAWADRAAYHEYVVRVLLDMVGAARPMSAGPRCDGVHFWAIRGRLGYYTGTWLTRRDAICEHTRLLGKPWRRCYRDGDRAMWVRLTAVLRPTGAR